MKARVLSLWNKFTNLFTYETETEKNLKDLRERLEDLRDSLESLNNAMLRKRYPLTAVEIEAMKELTGYEPEDITDGLVSPGMLARLEAKGMVGSNGLLSDLGVDVLNSYVCD